MDEALPALVNELAQVPQQLVLVLDDYHAIEDERIHKGMASLIEHLPASLRIVMTSRAEPALRVGTLRARAQLNEIDAAQLRFSIAEAESMLNDVHGLGLTAEAVERLHDRTELSGASPVVTDELTAREQEVLGLLPTGLSAREIGDELGISRDTVKTHTKRVYQKLGVSSRRNRPGRLGWRGHRRTRRAGRLGQGTSIGAYPYDDATQGKQPAPAHTTMR